MNQSVTSDDSNPSQASASTNNSVSTAGAGKNTASKKRFRISLFWKILGWFWLSMVIIITINLFVGYINGGKIHYRPLPPPLENELRKITNKTQNLFDGFRRINRSPRKRQWEIYLLDEQGQEFSNKTYPELLADLHSRVRRHKQPLVAFQRKQAFFGGSLIQIKEKNYWLYSRQRAPLINRHLVESFFRDIAKSILFSIFILSFPVSFLLSWLITGPIRRLQQTTRKMRHDLSNREDLEKLMRRRDEFGELATDFDNLANHLSHTLDSQKQLLSDVSHELRSPLARLKIALGMAENQATSATQDNLSRIKLECDRMNDMLSNLLTLSKLEAQEMSSEKETFDLCQIFQTVIEDGRFEAEQSNTEIQVDIPALCQFHGVKDPLISGIENILRNAIRYAGDNGLIKCSLHQQNDSITLSISDNGPGVPQAQLDKIFDAFYRPDLDRARNSGGVGLGLSIAKRSFALNGGVISAENLEPSGLKVTVKFST